MKYSFLPDAEAEYLEAIRFYEAKQLELGESLIHEFERAMVLVTSKLAIYRLVHPGGIRCISLARFPYSVFYQSRADSDYGIRSSQTTPGLLADKGLIGNSEIELVIPMLNIAIPPAAFSDSQQ